MLRSAITTQSSRSGSNAMVIMCVGVSAIGHSSFMSSRTVRRKVPVRPVSTALIGHLAVALRAVAVAGREQRALDEDRQIERGAGDQLLVVEVAAVLARRRGRDRAPGGRRRRAHHAEERAPRHFLAPRQLPHLARAIEHDVDRAAARRNRRAARRRAAAPRDSPSRRTARSSRCRPAAPDPAWRPARRPGRSACAGRAWARPSAWMARQRSRDLERRRRHQLARARDRRDGHALAAVDGQPRLQAGVEIAPMHGVGRRLEAVVGHDLLAIAVVQTRCHSAATVATSIRNGSPTSRSTIEQRVRRIGSVRKEAGKRAEAEFHEFRDVLRVHQIGGEFDDVGEARALRLQRGLDIGKDLLALRVEVVGADNGCRSCRSPTGRR